MFSIKVIRVTPLDNLRLLILFENGVQKIFDVNEIMTTRQTGGLHAPIRG